MNIKKLKLPIIFFAIMIIAYIAATLFFCYTTKPEIKTDSEHKSAPKKSESKQSSAQPQKKQGSKKRPYSHKQKGKSAARGGKKQPAKTSG